MPLTRQYLRYSPSGTFNIIASPECSGTWVTLKNQEGRFIATGTAENITIWDMNLVEKSVVLAGEKTTVSCLRSSPIKKDLAAGFTDGTVKTYDLINGETLAVFSGHKSPVTCLAYDVSGHRLASGAKDTNIVVWDVVAETGITRLCGHTSVVTSVCFMTDHNMLISSSKDTSIKFWDLDTNYCFKTLLGHRTEVWDFVLMRNEEFLVTGCGDSELRVWTLSFKDVKVDKENIDSINELEEDREEIIDKLSPVQSIKCGSILRSETGRVSSISCDSTGKVLAVHGPSGVLELFMFTSHLDALRRLKKRKKKERKNNSQNDKSSEEVEEVETKDAPSLQDIVRRLPVIKVKGKIKSSDLVLGQTGELRILMTLSNNTVEIYSLDINTKGAEPAFRRSITQPGHHSEVRAISFSSDNLAMVTGSGDSVKLWNRNSLACLRTIQTAYVVSLALVPGDRHAIAGLKDGKLLILDLNAGDILEEIAGHEKEVWSIAVTPDKRGIVSGGGDSILQFWDFDLIEDKESNITAKVLSLLHKRSFKVDDAVLCVKITPNSKFICAALLDMTVKVFFMDSLKFFLSLYGHKLPVLCMDISYDSSIIVTGSADRTIKIWGMDFGDCHKSILAHDDSVTALQFLPKTHYFFSCGKDGKIKQWDGDKFQKITTIDGHFGEAWSLAVSPNGEHVVTTGADKVIRLITKTDEPLVLEDEAEEERAKEEEEQLATDAETVVKGQGTLNLPSRKTVGSERAAEQILECLEICKDYSALLNDYHLQLSQGKKDVARPTPPALMMAYNADTPENFLVEIFARIRSSDLEEALLMLPYPFVCQMLEMFPSILKQDHHVELINRILMFVIKIHHGPIVSNQNLLPIIKKVTVLSFKRVKELRDMIGYNMHGFLYLQKVIEEKQEVQIFRDKTLDRKERDKKRKRKEQALKRAVLTL